MDFIDNLIFTTNNDITIGGSTFPKITSTYADPAPSVSNPVQMGSGLFTYSDLDRLNFCAYDDTEVIENAIQKHWFDVVQGRKYLSGGNNISNFDKTTGIIPYHLIYAYLTENTRIFQIFEKLLFMFQHDEELNKIDNPGVFQWLQNTESLFFKYQSSHSYNNLTSSIRLEAEASRRNAYYRMFGMELAFGNNKDNGAYSYIKAKFANNGFVPLFERFLIDFWQAYINRTNTSGVNTTDLENLADIAEKLQEMLFSRRTTNLNFNEYRHNNLSKEEFASVGLMSWLFNFVSNNNDFVAILNCTGNSPGERLTRLGQKVGIPAHSKSKNLFDLAAPAAQFLRDIENGTYNIPGSIQNVLTNNSPNFTLMRDNLLLIINNWEKATNHRIKNPESNIIGTVQVANKSLSFN